MEEVAYYYGLRTIARARTMEALNDRIKRDGGALDWNGTTLASIDNKAIDYAEDIWPTHYSGQTHLGFSRAWSSIWYHCNLQPSNFNIAVWQRHDDVDVLQGLAAGNTSDGKKHLTLNWVERNFGPEYCRFGVLLPILYCLEEYAALVGCERVLIKNPVDPSKYTKYGYQPYEIRKSTSVFLTKEVPNG